MGYGANRKDYRDGEEDVRVQSYEEEADDAVAGDPFEEDAGADAKEVAVRVPLASALLHSDGWSKRPFLPPDRDDHFRDEQHESLVRTYGGIFRWRA
jgi:hypothetical protein